MVIIVEVADKHGTQQAWAVEGDRPELAEVIRGLGEVIAAAVATLHGVRARDVGDVLDKGEV